LRQKLNKNITFKIAGRQDLKVKIKEEKEKRTEK
jgi:hypothetical protein